VLLLNLMPNGVVDNVASCTIAPQASQLEQRVERRWVKVQGLLHIGNRGQKGKF